MWETWSDFTSGWLIHCKALHKYQNNCFFILIISPIFNSGVYFYWETGDHIIALDVNLNLVIKISIPNSFSNHLALISFSHTTDNFPITMLAVFYLMENITIINPWVITHEIYHCFIVLSLLWESGYPTSFIVPSHLKVSDWDFHICTNFIHGSKIVSIFVVVQKDYDVIELHAVIFKAV